MEISVYRSPYERQYIARYLTLHPEIWNYELTLLNSLFPNSFAIHTDGGCPIIQADKLVILPDGTQQNWAFFAAYVMQDNRLVPKIWPYYPARKILIKRYPGLNLNFFSDPELKCLVLPPLGSNHGSHIYAAQQLELAFEYVLSKLNNHYNRTTVPFRETTRTAPITPSSFEPPQPAPQKKNFPFNLLPNFYAQEPRIQLMKAKTSPDCQSVVLSDRAYRSILAETSEFGDNETGGLMMGNFHNGIWYTIDSLDPGFDSTHSSTQFRYQTEYVNHLSAKVGRLYRHPLTIIGIWHRHPGSMDYFSPTDYTSMTNMVQDASVGLLFMLVNVDPMLRMTFYYLDKQLHLYQVPYTVGDKYIPREILEYATPEVLCVNNGHPVSIAPIPLPAPDEFPQTIGHSQTDPPTTYFP